MATGETGFDDVTYDLVSVQYHSLKAGHDYGQYVRDAENGRSRRYRGLLPTGDGGRFPTRETLSRIPEEDVRQ